MRIPRPRITLRRIMFLIAVLAIGIWGFARDIDGAIDYAAGWWDAEVELWEGTATLREWTLSDPGNICNIDRETGLRLAGSHAMIAGESRTRDTGHDDHIRQYIRWNGLPRNSFKPWERDLFDLKKFFDRRSKSEEPERLADSGPFVLSPNFWRYHRRYVQLRKNGTFQGVPKVVVSSRRFMLQEHFVGFETGDVDLISGPENSRFVVVRLISENAEYYAAFDIKTGEFLREETFANGRHVSPLDL